MKTAMQELTEYTEILKSTYDFSFDKFFNKSNELLEKEKQQKEDFASGFAEWLRDDRLNTEFWYEEMTINELLEIYKKEKGL